jgi:hypothetical protein
VRLNRLQELKSIGARRIKSSTLSRLERTTLTTQQIIIVAVLAIVTIVAFRAMTRKPSKATPSDDPNVFMPLLVEEAVKFAAGRGATLDYSPDSVQRVESLLGELHESRSAGKLADRDLNLHAHQFGAYIGEVLRRKYGGHWTEDHEVAGAKSFPIHWKDGQSFPVGWCGKRILNGDEDNVWHKYQVVTSDEYQSDAMTQPSSGPSAE